MIAETLRVVEHRKQARARRRESAMPETERQAAERFVP
jgi:hypothetical protein